MKKFMVIIFITFVSTLMFGQFFEGSFEIQVEPTDSNYRVSIIPEEYPYTQNWANAIVDGITPKCSYRVIDGVEKSITTFISCDSTVVYETTKESLEIKKHAYWQAPSGTKLAKGEFNSHVLIPLDTVYIVDTVYITLDNNIVDLTPNNNIDQKYVFANNNQLTFKVNPIKITLQSQYGLHYEGTINNIPELSTGIYFLKSEFIINGIRYIENDKFSIVN